MKRIFATDCKNNLRSGAGQVTAKFWNDSNELWGGSAGTEPLSFGFESISTTDIGRTLEQNEVGSRMNYFAEVDTQEHRQLLVILKQWVLREI